MARPKSQDGKEGSPKSQKVKNPEDMPIDVKKVLSEGSKARTDLVDSAGSAKSGSWNHKEVNEELVDVSKSDENKSKNDVEGQHTKEDIKQKDLLSKRINCKKGKASKDFYEDVKVKNEQKDLSEHAQTEDEAPKIDAIEDNEEEVMKLLANWKNLRWKNLRARKIENENDVKDLMKGIKIKKEPEDQVKVESKVLAKIKNEDHAKAEKAMSEDHVKAEVEIESEGILKIESEDLDKSEDSEKVKSACKTCANKALRKSVYKNHVRPVNVESEIDCDQCGQEAARMSNLKAHMRSVQERLDKQRPVPIPVPVPVPVPVRAVLEFKVGRAAWLKNQAWDPGRNARATAADAKFTAAAARLTAADAKISNNNQGSYCEAETRATTPAEHRSIKSEHNTNKLEKEVTQEDARKPWDPATGILPWDPATGILPLGSCRCRQSQVSNKYWILTLKPKVKNED